LGVVITGVEGGSIAHKLGILPGWVLEQIGGRMIEDVLDYRFYMAAQNLTLTLRPPGERARSFTLTKDEYQDLGLSFPTYLMDEQKRCKNRCVFCFVDQMPAGMRESLYFKDDDARMSFLFGNYITLTNLRERDIERIIAMRLSPINISVHTTNPDLRVKMMGHPKSGQVLGWLKRLAGVGTRLNTQLVVCPGFNDGDELARSLRDLTALAPTVQSIAIVPVGLTAHRTGLTELRPFSETEAAATLDTIDTFGEAMQRQHGQRICYASDEFYLLTGRTMPDASYYGAFDQLENGVGMSALLADEFIQALEDAPYIETPRKVSIATGAAAAPLIQNLIGRARDCLPNLKADVYPIVNHYFGQTITVAGLVTGTDLIAQLSGKELGDALLIPDSMLRHDGDLFLDDLSPEDVSSALGLPVIPVEVNGQALLDTLIGNQ